MNGVSVVGLLDIGPDGFTFLSVDERVLHPCSQTGIQVFVE